METRTKSERARERWGRGVPADSGQRVKGNRENVVGQRESGLVRRLGHRYYERTV